jgi:hypothetical protein
VTEELRRKGGINQTLRLGLTLLDHQTRIAPGYLKKSPGLITGHWAAPGSEDTELGVFMGPEVSHG